MCTVNRSQSCFNNHFVLHTWFYLSIKSHQSLSHYQHHHWHPQHAKCHSACVHRVCVCAAGQLRRRAQAISPGSELPLWSAKAKQSKRDARPSQRGLNIPESGHHKFPSPTPTPSILYSPVLFLLPSSLVISESPEEPEGKESERARNWKESKGESVNFQERRGHLGPGLWLFHPHRSKSGEVTALPPGSLTFPCSVCVFVCAHTVCVYIRLSKKKEDLFKRAVETVEGMRWCWKGQMKECLRSKLLY